MDINVKYIKFIKTSSKKRDCYAINYKHKSIKLNIKKCYIPFGAEKFNNRYVVNIEIKPDKSNDHYNVYQTIKELENKLKNLPEDEYCPEELKNDIENKSYYKNIKKRSSSYLVRCYILGTPEIFRELYGDRINLTIADIKETISDIELELGILWINNEEYGILWYIKKMNLL